jgi:hypothetical protein
MTQAVVRSLAVNSKVFQALRRLTLIKPDQFMIRLGEGERWQANSFEGDGWKLSGIQCQYLLFKHYRETSSAIGGLIKLLSCM